MAVQAETIKEAVWRHLQELSGFSAEQLVEDRYEKFRKIGKFEIAVQRQAEPAAEIIESAQV